MLGSPYVSCAVEDFLLFYDILESFDWRLKLASARGPLLSSLSPLLKIEWSSCIEAWDTLPGYAAANGVIDCLFLHDHIWFRSANSACKAKAWSTFVLC